MRKDFLFAIIATVLAMVGYFYYDRSEQNKLSEIEKQKFEQDLEQKQFESSQISSSLSADQTAAQAGSAAETEPAKPEDAERVFQQFSEHLKTIGTCLEIKNAVDSEKIDPNFDNLIVSLRPALGEVVVQMDDWTQRDLRNNQGERKRLRTETNYEDGGISSPTRRVQLYQLNEQNMPELQNIDPEQSVNPSEDYIESLKGGFETTIEEKGGRAYYQEGEELVFIERNGKLESVSLSRNGKTISCTGLDSVKSNCQCL
jgi:hypothetical protein